MSWFDEQAPRNIARITDPGTPVRLPASAAQGAPTPTTATTPAPGGAQQDPRAFFQSLFPGQTLTPQQLVAQEAALKAQGIRILGPNARGERTKIELPGGQIVDVIGGAGAGKNRNQWLVDRGGGGGGTLGQLGGYNVGTFTGGGRYPLAAVSGPGFMQPWTTPFQAPTVTDDPGFQFRMQEGQKALERSAAAKGTLLTGGALKDLAQYSQGLASQEYGNAYGRALGEYNLAHGIYEGNQQNQFGRLGDLAGAGQNAANAQAQAGTSYGQTAGGIITGRGDALGQGQLNQGQAWGGAVSNLGNIGSNLVMQYPYAQQGGYGGGYGGYPGTYYPAGTFRP